MGGLQVDITDAMCSKGLEPYKSRLQSLPHILLHLNPAGVIELYRREQLRQTPAAAIEDRSKANIIQKALVILQVTWMAVQCITRRVYGLPVSLLEIHTMVHVICALTVYAFWFEVSFILILYL